MKEFVEKLIEILEEESDFFVGEHMGSLQKAYYCKGVEKAIEIVKDLAESYHIHCEQEYMKGYEDGAESVRAMMPYEEHNNGWISVEDRLPEDNQCPVLACTRNDVMYTAVYDAVYDKWYDDNFEREIFITDWQPLPQAPRKGE